MMIPIPGVEPGPPGWKPGILTARPYGNYMKWSMQINVFEYNCWWEVQYFFFNVKAAQHFSKASLINHTELSEAKVSNRDESDIQNAVKQDWHYKRAIIDRPFLSWKQIKQNTLDKKWKCR